MRIEESIYPYNPELADLPFRLTGIGGSSYQREISRPEGFNWHQILFSSEGQGILSYGKTRVDIPENTFFFLPKNKPHTYYPVSKEWTVHWISFDGRYCDDTLSTLGMTEIIVAGSKDPSYMTGIFEKLFHSQKNDILYSGYTCSGLVYDYVIGFRRLFADNADNKKSRQLSALLPALQYMHEHYARDISMPELSEMLGITHQHFCRLFRSSLNMSPNDYLTALRIGEAKRLLSEQEKSVTQVASACGFHDPCYFSTCFKKHTGMSPSKYTP